MRALQEPSDSPLKKHLSDTTIRPLERPARQFTPKLLLDWLAAAADANTETLWAPLGEQLIGWAEELKLVCLEQQPPAAGRPPDSVLQWIQANRIDEGRAIARAVLHTVQQAAAS